MGYYCARCVDKQQVKLTDFSFVKLGIAIMGAVGT